MAEEIMPPLVKETNPFESKKTRHWNLSTSTKTRHVKDRQSGETTVYADVVIPYQAKNDKELNLQAGVIVKILARTNKGFLKGEIDGKIGLFPQKHVVLRVQAPAIKLVQAKKVPKKHVAVAKVEKTKSSIVQHPKKPAATRGAKPVYQDSRKKIYARPQRPQRRQFKDRNHVVLLSEPKTEPSVPVITPEMERAAVALQKTLKGHHARKQYQRKRREAKAAIIVQKNIRTWNQRKRFYQKKKSIVYIQKNIRGMLVRSTMRDLRQDLAKKNGVLLACEGTNQGREGWYEHDMRMKFYFSIDEQNAWGLVYGPLQHEEWLKYKKAVKESSSGLVLLPDSNDLYLNRKLKIIEIVSETDEQEE